MRATRELPLASCLLLTGLALFFGGSAGGGSLPWLGGGAFVALVLLLATRGAPAGALTLLPLAALVAWSALSIWWSTLGDRSWDYADRGLVYLAFATLGLWLAGRTRDLAIGLAVLLGGVAVWALAGKVVPPLATAPDLFGRARLRDPVGLWNQLALLGDFALPLALWLATRRRTAGVLLSYLWLVALVLTLSRGGIAVAVLVTAAWLLIGSARLEAAVTLVAAGVPAAAVCGIAFALPGVTGTGQSNATRWHHGLVFGAALLAGAAACAALARVRTPRPTPALRRAALGLALIVLAGVLVVGAVKAGSAWRSFTSSAAVGNSGPGRFGSASGNFRWVWWKQAWHGFEHHAVAGTGAGSFRLTNLRYRTSYLDVTTEPHDLPVQFLSELGIVGLVLLAAAAGALLLHVRRRRGHELALALILPAYLLHALIDIDWDFVAVSAPAFLVAGALAGRPAPERRASVFAVAIATGAAVFAFAALLMPWLGERWSDDASGALGGRPAHVIALARRARAVDPLLVEPLWWQADAESQPERKLALYDEATSKQPENPQTWLMKAQFELDAGCARMALEDFYKFNALDKYERPSAGPDDYRKALALVNTGAPVC